MAGKEFGLGTLVAALRGDDGPSELMEAVEGFRAAVGEFLTSTTDTTERLAAEQRATDEALAGVGDVAAFRQGRLIKIKTMYNIKCAGCGVVMQEVYFNAWRQVSPGTWSPFCDACRPGR